MMGANGKHSYRLGMIWDGKRNAARTSIVPRSLAEKSVRIDPSLFCKLVLVLFTSFFIAGITMDKVLAEEAFVQPMYEVPITVEVHSDGQAVNPMALKSNKFYQLVISQGETIYKSINLVSDNDVVSTTPLLDIIYIEKAGTSVITIFTVDESLVNRFLCTLQISATEDVPPEPILVQSVSILPPQSNLLPVGESLTMQAQVFPQDAVYESMDWQSSNTEVISIDYLTGALLALSPGKAVVSVSVNGNFADLIELDVVAPEQPTLDIAIRPLFHHPVQVEDTVYFSLEVDGELPIATDISWQIGSEEIAAVAQVQGNINTVALLAKKPGATILTVTAGNASAEYPITVNQAITGIVLQSLDKTAYQPGEQLQLHALGLPDRQPIPVQWSSGDSAIASVDAQGKVTCVGDRFGDVLIYASLPVSTGKVYTDFIRISVQNPVQMQVSLTAADGNSVVKTSTLNGVKLYSAPSGTLISLRAQISGVQGAAQALEWRVLGGNIALSGGSVGAAQPTTDVLRTSQMDTVVTVHCLEATTTQAEISVINPSSGASQRILFEVTGKAKVSAVQIVRPASTALNSGQYITMIANVYAKNMQVQPADRSVVWSSSNPLVASVEAHTGIVKGISAGEVVITATSEDNTNKYDSIILIVNGEAVKPINAEMTVLSTTLNVRAQPNTQGKILNLYRPLKMGDKVQVTERTVDGKWCRITISNEDARSNGVEQRYAYVAAAYIGQPSAVSVKAQNLTVRSNPNVQGAVMGRLALGDRVEALARSGAWLGVMYNGKVCYVAAKHTDEKVMGQVSAQTLTVREAPSTQAAAKSTLSNMNDVEILAREGHWYRIILNGRTAYVGAAYVNIK